MSQDLKIILTPKADTSPKTAEQLNQQIKSLEKKLNSLNLKTNIDASALKTLNDFSSAVDTYQKHLKSFNQTVKETTTVPILLWVYKKSKQEYVTILKR